MPINRRATTILLTAAMSASACSLVDDEPPDQHVSTTGGGEEADTEDPSDNLACINFYNATTAEGCPPGYTPQIHYDGGQTNVILADDPAAVVGANVGVLVNFGAGVGADWVAASFLQNSVCTAGCFAPQCDDGKDGCFATPASGGTCHLCADTIAGQDCVDLVLACGGIEPDPGDTDGTGDSGGADETGGADTSGGAMAGGYDCTTWNPDAIYQKTKGSPYVVPQLIVDQLVYGTAGALAECDGVLFRETSTGHFAISAMSGTGLLGGLGLQIGDEIQALDGVELDSLDAIAGVLIGEFFSPTGAPRQFSTDDPAMSFRVRRGKSQFLLTLQIEPASSGPGSDGADTTGGSDTTGGW